MNLHDFEIFGPDVENIRSQGCDNDANKMGYTSGVQQPLQNSSRTLLRLHGLFKTTTKLR